MTNSNPWAGEVALIIDGQRQEMKLTLGALAALETELDAGGLVALVERFETGAYGTRDVILVLAYGLQAGGWGGTKDELLQADIDGGLLAAVAAAGQLLARSFSLPRDP